MPSSGDIRSKLVTLVANNAVVSQSESVFSQLPDLVDSAFVEHAPDAEGDFTTLAVKEYELIMLLAWERVCLLRASQAAPQSSNKTTAPGFGADRDTPFNKNMTLAKNLRARYELLKSNLASAAEAEVTSGDITVGELYRTSDQYGMPVAVPATTAPLPTAPILSYREINGSLSGAGAGSVILSWTSAVQSFVTELILLRSTVAGIYEDWHEDSEEVPFTSDTSEVIYNTNNVSRHAVKALNLNPGAYYFVLAIKDSRENYVFTNEVKVTIPVIPAGV